LAWLAAYEAVCRGHTGRPRQRDSSLARRAHGTGCSLTRRGHGTGPSLARRVGVARVHYSWWLVAAAACGLGILTKGPVALLLRPPPLWAYRCWQGKACRIGWRALLVFAAALLCVTLPWYIAICFRSPAFAGYFFWQHNVLRFLVPFDHLRPIW